MFLDTRYVIWYWKFLSIKRLGALNIFRLCMLKEDTTIWVVINHTRIPCILINFDMQEFCGKMQRVNESSLIAQNIISKALSHIENNGGMYRSFWRHKWFYAVLWLLRQIFLYTSFWLYDHMKKKHSCVHSLTYYIKIICTIKNN